MPGRIKDVRILKPVRLFFAVTTTRWFLLKEKNVCGPYDDKSLDWELQIYPNGLVWGPGLNEWISGPEWREKLFLIEKMILDLKSEATPCWWYKDGPLGRGPFTYEQLILELKKSRQASDIELKQAPSQDYKSIYAWPTIVEEIGITRRRHHRVPLSGFFHYEKNNKKFQAPITTISVGGFGLNSGEGLSVGESLKGEISSPQFGMNLYCEAEVLVKLKNGGWGFRFELLPLESEALLASYIKKFATNS